MRRLLTNPVGVSLLAKASAHAATSLSDTPHSRASSLPQGVRVAPVSAVRRSATATVAPGFADAAALAG
ncbi:hypothetical protein CRX57_27530 [Pseudomonas putida]|uniref:Uncharacterized protein n=1 Tax=Pseudomonas putida TaxID=303 RepID=A0A2C5WFQ8_PSEPU|nr:hypothetical protein CRX57_27530 [Pseudomonas putida]